MKKSAEQQITALFVQAMRTALAIIDEKAAPAASAVRALPVGVYAHKSKYNPFRAYSWNGAKSIYLGAFPSIAAAKRAQKAFRDGKQPTEGSRVANRRKPLQIVKAAAQC